MEQLMILPNGNLSPCPWRINCFNHPKGCYGNSYWCGRFDDDPEGTIKEHERLKGKYKDE